MTPKEKAQELVDKFLENMPSADSTNVLVEVIAKDCALIAVNEIIDVVFYASTCCMYWEEVKQEIEKL